MLKRRQKRTMEFVTSDERARDQFPPRPALQAAPDWFKKSSNYVEQRRFPNLRLRSDVTIRGCPGVADYLSLGYILPLWCDLIVTADENGFSFEVVGDYPPLDVFRPDQWHTFPRAQGDHCFPLKLTSPWRLRTPPGWSTLILPPWYVQESRWSVMPGVVDTDRYGVLSPIVVWHVPMGESVLMKAGTPIAHLVPFRSDSIDLSVICDADQHQQMVKKDNLIAGNRVTPGVYREHGRRTKAHTT